MTPPRPTLAVLAPDEHMPGSFDVARSHGFEPVGADTVRVADHDDGSFDELVEGLDEGSTDWVVFTSVQSVESAARLAQSRDLWLNALVHGARVASAGPSTHAALFARSIDSLAPAEHTEAGMVRFLTSADRLGQGVVALVRRADAGPGLVDGLEAAGATVLDVPVFELGLPEDRAGIEDVVERIVSGEVAALATVAGVLVENLLLAGDEAGCGDDLRVALTNVAIGALDAASADEVRRLGFDVAVVPQDARFETMVARLGQAVTAR